jgi:hypothetical protein
MRQIDELDRQKSVLMTRLDELDEAARSTHKKRARTQTTSAVATRTGTRSDTTEAVRLNDLAAELKKQTEVDSSDDSDDPDGGSERSLRRCQRKLALKERTLAMLGLIRAYLHQTRVKHLRCCFGDVDCMGLLTLEQCDLAVPGCPNHPLISDLTTGWEDRSLSARTKSCKIVSVKEMPGYPGINELRCATRHIPAGQCIGRFKLDPSRKLVPLDRITKEMARCRKLAAQKLDFVYDPELPTQQQMLYAFNFSAKGEDGTRTMVVRALPPPPSPECFERSRGRATC